MVVFITNHYYSLGERPKSHQIYPLFKRVMPIESVSNKVIHLAVHELTSLLLYHCSAESRGLRCWLKHDVIPALDGMSKASDPEEPTPCMLEWPELSISMLNWRGDCWIRLRDMPVMLPTAAYRNQTNQNSWVRRLTDFMRR